MTITSLHGDALDILPTLEVGSIQALVTSPPYHGLRQYAIPPSSWHAVEYTPLIGLPPVVVPPMVCQLGAEPDPLAYIGHLVHVFRLARPALRKDATLWVNLGDSYANIGRTENSVKYAGYRVSPAGGTVQKVPPGFTPKNLLGIPARAALALQADGWVWRNDIIWHAPNKMPESVRDRFTRAHEDVLLFGNSARYYFDSEAVAEAVSEGTHGGAWNNGGGKYQGIRFGPQSRLGNSPESGTPQPPRRVEYPDIPHAKPPPQRRRGPLRRVAAGAGGDHGQSGEREQGV